MQRAPTLNQLKIKHGLKCDSPRPTAGQRGYGKKWQTERAEYLKNNPLCIKCRAEGIIEKATVVDHIKPHKGDQHLFWDKNNWQPLCKYHHDRKTVMQDGGFSTNAILHRVCNF